jgi:ribosomal protein S27AE
VIENLGELHRVGVEAFVELERARQACPHCGALVSVHRTACLACGKSVEDTRGAGLTRASS